MSKKEDKRMNIILGFKICLSKGSYDTITTRKIALAADMSLGLLHYYFKSKEEILFAYTDYLLEQYLNVLTELDEYNIISICEFCEMAMYKYVEDEQFKDIRTEIFQIKYLTLNYQFIKEKYTDTSNKLLLEIEKRMSKFNSDKDYIHNLAVFLITIIEGANVRKITRSIEDDNHRFFLNLIKDI